MKFNRNDLTQMKNLTKAISKGKWELDGLEILAFSDMMRWIGGLQSKMEIEIANDELAEKAKLDEQKKINEGKIEPKPVEDIVKQIDTPKVNKAKR